MTKYKYNGEIDGLRFLSPSSEIFISIDKIRQAVEKANKTIKDISAFDIDVFSMLGMRNLSAFIGEVFVGALVDVTDGLVVKNPHQDGYPDLLTMTPEGKKAWEELKNNLRDKKPFSPFKTGGIEVKATCGSLPTPAVFVRRGLLKPDIGDTRIEYVTGYDWKSHHRETNNLIGMFWDFIEGRPTIVALFYSGNKLTIDDWGTIIQPKAGGGRTTSVSIMTREGVAKMYRGWVVVIDDNRYIDFFNRYNKGSSMPTGETKSPLKVSKKVVK